MSNDDPFSDWDKSTRKSEVQPMPMKLPVPDGYELKEQLGGGGFGIVHKALRGKARVEAALKFVPTGLKSQLELRALETIRAIRHAHLVSVIDYFEQGDFLIIDMELADGTLKQRFESTMDHGQPVTEPDELAELLKYFEDAAEAIDYLNKPVHVINGREMALRHRDVKPENFLLFGGSVKLTDYGLVKETLHTSTGHSGYKTPAYAPPEFFSGATHDRSDQFSLAVTYCHVRGGKLPFNNIEAKFNSDPDLTVLPEKERPVLARALAKDSEKRWKDCASFVKALVASMNVADVAIKNQVDIDLRPAEHTNAQQSLVVPRPISSVERPATITGAVPFRALIEITSKESDAMQAILDDLHGVVLKENPTASVLTDPHAEDVCTAGKKLEGSKAVLKTLRQILSTDKETLRRVFEWTRTLLSGERVAIVITTMADSVFIYNISSYPKVSLSDCTSEPIERVLERRSEFTAFPTIYDDMMENLNWHTSRGLLTPTYVYGYQAMTFPHEVLASTRVLLMQAAKIVGTDTAGMSEVATNAGKGLMAFDASLGLMNRVWLFPFNTWHGLYYLLDYIALILHEYLHSKGIPTEYLGKVVENMERVLRLMQSQPLSMRGALEGLIDERRVEWQRRGTRAQQTQGVQMGKQSNVGMGSVEDCAEAIRREFEQITEVRLTTKHTEVRHRGESSRIEFVMAFPSGESPICGMPSAEFEQVIKGVSEFARQSSPEPGKSIHSVRYRPFLLQDAVVFVVKVNWTSYPEEETVEFWDHGQKEK